MKRIGQKSFLTIFFILAAALTVTGWFQAQTSAGSQTQDILEQSIIAESQAQESNSRNFIKQSLGISAAQASGQVAKMSGRKQEGDKYRYWLCKGEAQVPEKPKIRGLMSSITQQKMNSWLGQIRGKQGKWIRSVGQQTCSEVGYRTPMDTPDNDNFLAGIGLTSLNVSHVNGTVTRQDIRPNISSRVRYNRVWYVYRTTKKYIQNDSAENMKDSVRELLRNMSDKAKKVNRGCGTVQCPKIGDTWRSDQPVLIKEAVSKGINRELRKLENHKEYFNGNEVSCSFEFKEKQNADGEMVNYPTWEYIPVPTDSCGDNKEVVGGCGTCTCDGPSPTSSQDDGATTKRVDAREDPPGGGGGGGGGVCPCGEWSNNKIEGTAASALHWNVWADIKVTCTDEKFNSIPKEQKLENLTWRFDMNFKVEERSVDNPFVCEGSDVESDFACAHAYNKKPWSLRQCSVSSTQQQPICDSGVNTIEQTR